MAARSSGSGSENVRLGLAFAASLALHAALLFPFGFAAPPLALPPDALPLEARLTALPLAAAPQEDAPIEAPVDAPVAAPVAVPPAPTFAPPAAPAPAPRPPQPLAGRRLESALAALAREEFYPREAIARGLEGTVTLLVALDRGGRVVAVSVAGSSGHALLDEAALAAAARIGLLPGAAGEVLLPVEFRLE